MKKFYTLLMAAAVAASMSAAKVEANIAKTIKNLDKQETVQFTMGEKTQFAVKDQFKPMHKTGALRLPGGGGITDNSPDVSGEYVFMPYDEDYESYISGYATPQVEKDGKNYVIRQFIFSDALDITASVGLISAEYNIYALTIPSQTPFFELDGATYVLLLFDYGEDGASPTVYSDDIPFMIDPETGDMMLAYEGCGIAWLNMDTMKGNWVMEPVMIHPNGWLTGNEYLGDGEETEAVEYPLVVDMYESGDLEIYNFASMELPVLMEYDAENKQYVAENALVGFYTYQNKDYPIYAYNYESEDGETTWLVGEAEVTDESIKVVIGDFFCALELGWLVKMADAVITIGEAPAGGDGVATVSVDANAPVEFYNLQGQRIANPAAGQLVIRRQGNVAEKLIVR